MAHRDKRTAPRDVPKMTPGRAVLVGLMERYLRGLTEPWGTLLDLHKRKRPTSPRR